MSAVARRAPIQIQPPPDFDQVNEFCALLLAKIAGGDESALAALYDTTVPLLLGLATRILKDRGTAEEVVLDVYLQIWQQAGRYNRERGKPLTWLTIIARTRAVDRLRSLRSYERHESRFATTVSCRIFDSPEENARLTEMRKYIRQAFEAELLQKEREVIELAYFSGLSHSEIALIVNEPLGTVKTRIRTGIRKLHRTMEFILGNC